MNLSKLFRGTTTTLLAVAAFVGASSLLTGCTGGYYERPVYVRPAGPIFVQPAPRPVIIEQTRRPYYVQTYTNRPVNLGTVDSRGGKLFGNDKINHNATTTFSRTDNGRVNVNVPYRDGYGDKYRMQERHKVHTDLFGQQYIKANGTGHIQYLNSNGTVNTGYSGSSRHHGHR